MEDIESALNLVPGTHINKEFLIHSYPRHKVKISEFSIASKPVTLLEFKEFIEATGYVTEAEKEGWGWTMQNGWVKTVNVSWKSPFGNEADMLYRDNENIVPVIQISWNDAEAFCRWKSKQSGQNIRFIAENDWGVLAERCGIKSIRDAGALAQITNSPGFPRFIEDTEYLSAIIEEVNDSGKLLPGYIWEWTDDWFKNYPGGIENKEYGATYKVLRGGSLLSHPMQRMREYRFRRCPTARSPYYCFRAAAESYR